MGLSGFYVSLVSAKNADKGSTYCQAAINLAKAF